MKVHKLSRKILVIRGGAIGDFILTLPVLAALREQFPQAGLELLGYPHIAQLALAGGLVDAVRSIDAGPLAGFFAHAGNLDKRLQEYFGGFEIIISYLYDPDAIFQTNVARCSKAQFIAGPHRPDETAGVHATRVLLKPLERLAIFEASHVPRLQITAAERAPTKAGGGAHPVLVLHPGSGSERKNWPEAAWAEMLRELAAVPDLEFRLAGGEVEGTRLDRLAAFLPQPRTELWRSLPLVQLAGQLAACDAFVGHDSGISHLAAALGVPTLVLWGETLEAIWRPQGHHVRVLSAGPSLATLPVPTVLASLCPVTRRAMAGG